MLSDSSVSALRGSIERIIDLSSGRMWSVYDPCLLSVKYADGFDEDLRVRLDRLGSSVRSDGVPGGSVPTGTFAFLPLLRRFVCRVPEEPGMICLLSRKQTDEYDSKIDWRGIGDWKQK